MSDPTISTKVSPEVHPTNTCVLVGDHVPDTDAIVTGTKSALEVMYVTLTKISDARTDLDALTRIGLTPVNFERDNLRARGLVVGDQGRLSVARPAHELLSEAGAKAIEAAGKKVDVQMDTLRKQSDHLNKEIDAALKDTAHSHVIRQEIRAHLAAMPEGERMSFAVRQARAGDLATVTAILEAPEWLSGLNVETRALVRAAAAERVVPQLAARHAAAERAKDILIRASRHLITELASLGDYAKSRHAEAGRKVAAVRELGAA